MTFAFILDSASCLKDIHADVTFLQRADVDMDADDATKPNPRSNSQLKKQKAAKSARVEKKRHRRVRNSITFTTRNNKSKKGKKS